MHVEVKNMDPQVNGLDLMGVSTEMGMRKSSLALEFQPNRSQQFPCGMVALAIGDAVV